MISVAERQERLEAVADVIGTHRAEGITFDEPTRELIDRYANGELSLTQLSAAMRTYANSLGTNQQTLVSAA